MKYVGRLFTVMAVAAAVAVAVPATASDTTVGDFVVKLAETKNLRAADSRAAVEALRTLGVRLPSDLDLDAALTEGDVTKIAAVTGLNVRTSRPDRAFGRLQVERFFASFSDELDTASLRHEGGPCEGGIDCPNPGEGGGPGNGNGGPPFDPFSKGKGKHKGKAKQHQTPSEPE